MATITNRGSLQWRARVCRKGYPITSKTFETKADAKKWARQVESEMDRDVFVSREEAEGTTLKEALNRSGMNIFLGCLSRSGKRTELYSCKNGQLPAGFLLPSGVRILLISLRSGRLRGLKQIPFGLTLQ